MPSHEQHTRSILTKIEVGKEVSQRSLAKELGIALGLTNSLIRKLVKKGWVKVMSSFRGAVKGVVIQQVQVLPEELTVHLDSYGAGAVGDRHD